MIKKVIHIKHDNTLLCGNQTDEALKWDNLEYQIEMQAPIVRKTISKMLNKHNERFCMTCITNMLEL